MKKNVFKRIAVAGLSVLVLMTTACNTKIKVNYDYKAEDYVELGDYKGINVTVNTSSIVTDMVNEQIESDRKDNTTYSSVTRGAVDGDKLSVTFTGKISGETASNLSNENYEMELGKTTFPIDGFMDALYGMTAGSSKIITLTVPENYEDNIDYAGKRIVYEISVSDVKQPNVPMLTDAYVKEKYSCETVADYREYVQSQLQTKIDLKVQAAKEEAVLTKLQDVCRIKNYPDGLLDSRKNELRTTVEFYAKLNDMTIDAYCEKQYGIDFDEYVERSAAQQLILQAIVEKENLVLTEYEYKGELESFASRLGSSDKDAFVEKNGKDKIVKAMLTQQAEEIVLQNATVTEE